ncbi:hypothetical protein S83_025884 [Arachis hypogaea]
MWQSYISAAYSLVLNSYFTYKYFQDLPTESETVIPYVHSMKQAHKILRTVISPRLICSKLLRYLQQLQLGQWQLTILGWLQIRSINVLLVEIHLCIFQHEVFAFGNMFTSL